MMRDMKLARAVKKNRRFFVNSAAWEGKKGDSKEWGDTYVNREPNFKNSSAGLHLPPCICMEMPERATAFAESIFERVGHRISEMVVMFSVSQRRILVRSLLVSMMYNMLSENSSLTAASRKEGAERVRVSKGDSEDWSADRSSLRRLGKTAEDEGWESGDEEGREPTKPRRAFMRAGGMDKAEDVDEVGAGNEAAVTPSDFLILPRRDSCIHPG